MPRVGQVKSVSGRRVCDLVSVGVIARSFPPGLVDEVVAGCGRTEERSRSLPGSHDGVFRDWDGVAFGGLLYRCVVVDDRWDGVDRVV